MYIDLSKGIKIRHQNILNSLKENQTHGHAYSDFVWLNFVWYI